MLTDNIELFSNIPQSLVFSLVIIIIRVLTIT